MEEKTEIAHKFHAYTAAVALAAECDNRDRKAEHAAYGGYNGTIKQDTLYQVLASKTAIMHERLSLVGYLVIVARLFKIAFIDKKRQRGAPSIWLAVC